MLIRLIKIQYFNRLRSISMAYTKLIYLVINEQL